MEAIPVDPVINKSAVVPSFKSLALEVDNSALLLEYILCIYYLIQFKKDQIKVQALLDSSSKVNVIPSAYTTKLGLKV